MIVQCSIESETKENDEGIEVATTLAHCSKSGHETSSFGNSEKSIKRCLVLVREECPRREWNFYRSVG